jgi:hypothetical protein
LIAAAFAVLTTVNLQQFAESIEVNPLEAGYRFLKVVLMTKSATFSDCLRWINLTIGTKDYNLPLKHSTHLLDTVIRRQPAKPLDTYLSEVESAIKFSKALPTTLRPVLISSTLFQSTINTCFIHVNLTQLEIAVLGLCEVLFKDNTSMWLRPGMVVRTVTDKLFTEFSPIFPFSRTYQALAPACRPALELLNMWLDHKQKKPEKAIAWLKSVDEQLSALPLSAEELEQLAEETVGRLYEMKTDKRAFVRLVT